LSDIIVAPETRDLDSLATTLSAWLRSRIEGAVDLAVTDLSYPRGAGQSHETILFSARWQGGALEGVVRIKPGGFTVFPDNLFDEQFRVMQAMFDSGLVRVAEPLWLESDPSVLGRPFFIMRKVSGRVPVSVPPYSESGWVFDASPAQRRVMWEDAVRQLAAVQQVPVTVADFLAGPEHARSGLAQEFDKYRRFVRWLAEDAGFHPLTRIVGRGLDRLERLWPANQPEGLVWGDARLGNMMFGDDYRVVAVMDWEQPSLGGALHDLAWFVTMGEVWHNRPGQPWFAGMGTRAETVALWQEVCGKSADDLEWYEDFTRLKMSCTGIRLDQLRGTRTYSEEGLAKRLKVG
jgi:aminoglycoside phosphotransferase (APT) family kinase protein